MSEFTSWTPGVAAAYYNDEDEDYYLDVGAAYYIEDYYTDVPGVAAAYNEEYLSAPGVRFVATDQELIVDYLGRKLRGESPPTDVVRDGYDAYAEHPKKLVQKLGEAIQGSWYLFSPRTRKYAGGMRPKRGMGDEEGHWKAMGGEKPVRGGTDGKEVLGTTRALMFVEDTYEVGSHGRRRRVKNKAASKPSKWKMVEYVCRNSCRAPGNDTGLDPMLLNDYVLCKIIDRSLSVEGEGHEEEEPTPDGGGGEPYEMHLPEQQQEGGGGAGGTQADQGPSGGGAASRGIQQPAPAEAPMPDYDFFDGVNEDALNNWLNDAQTAEQQQASSSGGGAGSANERQKPPGLLLR